MNDVRNQRGRPQEPVQELARQASDLRSGRGNVGRVHLKPEGRHRIAVSPESLSVSTRLSREHIHQRDFREADLNEAAGAADATRAILPTLWAAEAS